MAMCREKKDTIHNIGEKFNYEILFRIYYLETTWLILTNRTNHYHYVPFVTNIRLLQMIKESYNHPAKYVSLVL